MFVRHNISFQWEDVLQVCQLVAQLTTEMGKVRTLLDNGLVETLFSLTWYKDAELTEQGFHSDLQDTVEDPQWVVQHREDA